MDNINAIFANLPCSVKAYTICKDGFYTVILNQNLSREQNIISYNHELKHIFGGDFESRNSVGMIELFAHQI